MKKELIFTRFERFWHWAQMLLIFALLVSGFEIHGSYQLLGFQKAVMMHNICAWGLLGLWALAIFWTLTTGEWKHYRPSSHQMLDVIRFYSYGIFRGEHHPYRRKRWAKHNPLQRLAYLLLNTILMPMIWVSGLFYMFYGLWMGAGAHPALPWVATIHVAGAWLMLVFIAAHVYIVTTGDTVGEHMNSLLTGYGDVDDDGKKQDIS